RGSAGRAAAGAIGIGNAVGAALTNRRLLGPAEAKMMLISGILLLGLSAVGVLWPRWITIPLAVLGAWVALSLFIRAYKLHAEGERSEEVKHSRDESPAAPPVSLHDWRKEPGRESATEPNDLDPATPARAKLPPGH
ncbi:MAG: hypothetical protein ACRD68_07865, partial [Pyrinomonadaceae bacterium]